MKKAFTLLELLIAAAIFTVLFAMALSTLTIQNNNWRRTQDKLLVQQEARRGMDTMSRLLRQSNPAWEIGDPPVNYPVTVTTVNSPNDRIDFYRAEFVDNPDGTTTTTLKLVTFKLNPANPTELLEKDGSSAPVVVANNVAAINFGGGCPPVGGVCTTFNCANVDVACPVVEMVIQTSEPNPNYQPAPVFNLTSRVTLRNSNAAPLGDGTLVEEPPEGEF